MPKMMKSKSKTGKNKKILGTRGVMRITAPVSQSYVIRQPRPQVQSRGTDVVVRNSERISSVGVSSATGVYVDALIPLIPARFPYLVGVASNYATYRFTHLKVTYITSTGTTTTGQHGMGFIYEASDGPSTTLTTVSALQGSVMHPLWGGSSAGLVDGPGAITTEPDRARYTVNRRFATLPNFNALSNPDKLLFCNVWLLTATAGSTLAGIDVGSLYIDYTVILSDPIPIPINA